MVMLSRFGRWNRLRRAESDASGGYDFNFVNELSEEFLCPICLLVLREPHLSGCCGHHFCQTCITRVKDDRGACPLCKQRYFITLMDKSVQRKVNDLRIFCRSKEEGCRWEGELSSYEFHVQLCKYVEVVCDYECGVKVFRCYLEGHKNNMCVKRPFSCKHCGHKATWQEVIGDHTKVCEKYPVLCPNSCGDEIPRIDVDAHLLESCPLTVVPCKFEFAGCSEITCRKNKLTHLESNMVSHLSLLADTCVQLKKDSEAKDEKIAQLEKRIHSLTMKLDTATSSEASMYTPLLANDPRCSSSSASVIEEAALSRASSEDDVNQTGAIMLMDRQKTGEPVTEFVVENVQERIERGDTWYTEAFSTHRNGYHMCLGVTVRRSWQWRVSTSQTQSYFLSVYAYLTPGESDDILRWPFRGDLYLSFHLDNDVIVKGGIIFNARSKPNASIRPHRRRNTSGEGCVVKVEDKQFKENLLISIDRVDVRDVCMQPIYH